MATNNRLDTEYDLERDMSGAARRAEQAQHRNDANRDERMEAADRHQFCNRLRLLRFIERDDLRRVGIDLPEPDWQRFSSNPAGFLVRADDTIAEAIFRVIRKQETRR